MSPSIFAIMMKTSDQTLHGEGRASERKHMEQFKVTFATKKYRPFRTLRITNNHSHVPIGSRDHYDVNDPSQGAWFGCARC